VGVAQIHAERRKDRRTDRERDGHDEGNIDAFRNNSNAAKKVWTLISVPHV